MINMESYSKKVSLYISIRGSQTLVVGAFQSS